MTTASSTDNSRIKQVLAKSLSRAPDTIDEGDRLTDLVAESFALVETVITLQEELGIRLAQDDLRGVETVADLMRVCSERL